MPDTPGSVIRKARQIKGITQEQLAEAVGVSRFTVICWERDQHFPSRKAGAIEHVLGIDLPEPEPEPETAAS